ncbi:O-antigen ligase family protein [Polynucleobacter sp. MWH-Svant-W18]|uniref:O-antigen ligase family protein n=1 Tax=Polynucleobacter sp. MWH-Svant-W18 TaxID=1855909 RepID=UPI001BFD7FF1|nr:O-antigen ligase family protein [Polynucleobacter sp. MWH-Svant-W18]QWD78217.1 O-antigen ligase family protein [Polynucleobacter sp. MWH-Svant-W18]
MNITEKQLANISVASVCALLCIWVLPGTIVLRHVLLCIGCIAGIFLIRKNWAQLIQPRFNLIPLGAIAALFFWVGIHYCFFSLNSELELSEIKGLWLRSLAGCIMAIGFATALSKHTHLRKYFYVSIFAVPFFNLVSYVVACIQVGGFVKPIDFFQFYFAKIETAYFGAIATAVAVANLVHLLFTKNRNKDHLQIALYFLGIALVVLSDLVANTKNGIAISLSLCILLSLIILVKACLSYRNSKKVALTVLALMLLLMALVWQGHKSFAFGGWDTIFEDVKVAIDIDKNTQWQRGEGTVEPPLNSLGIPAVMNTYSRFSWGAVGVRLIGEYPLGYGSINQSFNRLQSYANIYHEHGGQVHSGWIDFGLAFGIPGLILIFLALILIIYYGVRQSNDLSLMTAIYCLMLVPFGLIAEISYKQYFEATLFFLAFSATIVAISPKAHEESSPKYYLDL